MHLGSTSNLSNNILAISQYILIERVKALNTTNRSRYNRRTRNVEDATSNTNPINRTNTISRRSRLDKEEFDSAAVDKDNAIYFGNQQEVNKDSPYKGDSDIEIEIDKDSIIIDN